MLLRTSKTHPLIINEIPCLHGTIGMTFCPGKKQTTSLTGGWNRNIHDDIKTIKEWNADIVITLLETHEFDELKVPHFKTDILNACKKWYHLPIRDKSIPCLDWLSVWFTIREELISALNSGQRILIHCKGGFGRTGLMATQLLLETHTTVSEALCIVRESRNGAVETAIQEFFVAMYKAREFHPRLGDSPFRSRRAYYDWFVSDNSIKFIRFNTLSKGKCPYDDICLPNRNYFSLTHRVMTC